MREPQVVRFGQHPSCLPVHHRAPIRLILALLGAVAMDASSVRAQTIVLDDGFESYPQGPFNMVGPWVGHDGIGTGCSIVNAPVQSGAQALEVTMVLGPDPNDQGAPHARYYFPCPSTSGSLEVHARKGNASTQYLEIQLREGTFPVPASGQLFSVIFPWFGEVRYSGADYPFTPFPTPFFYNGGQWYHVRIDWHPNSTADVWIDGVLQGAGLAFHSAMASGVEWIGLAISASEPGTESGWFDNVKVTIDDACATPVKAGTWGRLKSMYR